MSSAASPDVAALIAEMDALKRRLRFYGRALAATCASCAAAAALLVASPLHSQATRMTFNEITLVDSTGKPRGVWSGDTGLHIADSALALYNAAGARRLVVNVAGNEPAIQFFDVQGKTRMALDVSGAGDARIAQSDDQGKERVLLATDSQRIPKLVMNDVDGNRRILMNVEGGEPVQTFYAADGKYRLYMNGGGFPRTVLFDGAGKVRSVLAVDNDNNPFLSLNDGDEKRRFLLNVANSEPTQTFLDANGRYRLYLNGGGFPRTVMFDGENKARNVMAVDNAGLPFLALSDAAEKRRLLINVENDRGNVYFRDANGNTTDQLPAPPPAQPPAPAAQAPAAPAETPPPVAP